MLQTMKIVIAPDSFKGTLSAADAAQAIARGLRQVWPAAELCLHPMADGGEGTLAAIAAAVPADWRQAEVHDLAGQLRQVRWLQLPDGAAVLESAEVVGLGLAGDCPVPRRSSLGLGELLLQVLDAGCRRVLIGLGGTGSNDGGAGLLAAVGAELLDKDGERVTPDLAGLADLASLSLAHLDPRLAETRLQVWADVASPLAGPMGATAIFGPQKGVQADEVARYDGWLARLGLLGDQLRGQDLRLQPGSGAAGGLGWALRVLSADMVPGAEAIALLQRLDASLADADYLITGEGRSDLQTPLGKLPWRLAAMAQEAGVPAVLLSGEVVSEAQPQLAERFAHRLSLAGEGVSSQYAQQHAATLLAERAAAWAAAHRR